MGNRGTVVFTDGKGSYSPAVYLHWNGSAESIYPFLEELDRRKARNDQDYECARFIQLVGEFFDQDEIGSTSLGVANSPKSDNPKELDKIALTTAIMDCTLCAAMVKEELLCAVSP